MHGRTFKWQAAVSNIKNSEGTGYISFSTKRVRTQKNPGVAHILVIITISFIPVEDKHMVIRSLCLCKISDGGLLRKVSVHQIKGSYLAEQATDG